MDLPLGIKLSFDKDGLPVKEANPNIYGIYAREAKVYDTAMVERWKTAMEGILIFAGLFSAAVTAFIIESYKTLQPDSGDLTVNFLYQLTQQVAAMNNGTLIPPNTLLPPPADVAFTVPSSAVITNVLWFISLGLSLACAVSATLVQQWARNYIYTIERRPSAKRRARIRMYLYEGVQRFRMSEIIDGIPALLHCALFTFLLGLVFFIRSISNVLAIVSGVIFGLCVFAYLFATFLPLAAFDSPIQTPLTGLMWRRPVIKVLYWMCGHALMIGGFVWPAMTSILSFSWTAIDLLIRELAAKLHGCITILQVSARRVSSMVSISARSVPLQQSIWSTVASKSFDEVRTPVAIKKSAALQKREERAFHWLVKCLDEDKELLLFIEAVPKFLTASKKKRFRIPRPAEPYVTRTIVSTIFNDPELQLYHRLIDLLVKHRNNCRVISACVEVLAVLDPNGWRSIGQDLSSVLGTAVRYLPCAADLRCRIHCLLAKSSAQLSVHSSENSMTLWAWQLQDLQLASPNWPIKYCQMWNELLEESCSITQQVGSHLSYFILARLALDVLVMNRGQLTERDIDSFADAADVVLDQLIPRLVDTSFELPSEHYVLHCRATVFVLQVLDDVHHDSFGAMAPRIERLLFPSGLINVADRLPLGLVDQILQQPFLRNYCVPSFLSVVESLQHLGPMAQRNLSAQTLAHHKMLKALLPGGRINETVDLMGMDGQSQVQFVRMSELWFRCDPDTLGFDTILCSLYSLNDPFAQRLALEMVDNVPDSVNPEQREMLVHYRSYLRSIVPPDVAFQTEPLGRPSRGVQADTDDGAGYF